MMLKVLNQLLVLFFNLVIICDNLVVLMGEVTL